MKLHEDKESFRVLIDKVSSRSNISANILEKDYYVCLILQELSKKENQGYAYFKGGTALYKCLHSIKRFSEDVDLTVDISNCKTNSEAKTRLKNSAKKFTCLGKGEVLEDKKGSIIVTYKYKSLYDFEIKDILQRNERVKVESTSFTVSEPTILLEIAPCIYEFSDDKDKIILKEMFDVKPFKIRTIKLERIFIDKIFAAEYYFKRKEYFDVAKHCYDLSVLLENEEIKQFLSDKIRFNDLVEIERKEELKRIGGIPNNTKISSFTFFNELEDDEEFIESFNKMQNIYVINLKDKIEVLKVLSSLKILKGIIILLE